MPRVTKRPKYRFIPHRGKGGDRYWAAICIRNGESVGIGGEGIRRRASIATSLGNLLQAIQRGEIEVHPDLLPDRGRRSRA